MTSAVALQQVGPRLHLTIAPLEEHAKAMAERGEVVPSPIAGSALIDTGASHTCVDRLVAEQAGLAVVDSGPMASATEEARIVPVYAGKLDIAGVPQDLLVHRAYGATLAPQGLIALIGRDALSSCLLVYNGPDGTYSLAL